MLDLFNQRTLVLLYYIINMDSIWIIFLNEYFIKSVSGKRFTLTKISSKSLISVHLCWVTQFWFINSVISFMPTFWSSVTSNGMSSKLRKMKNFKSVIFWLVRKISNYLKFLEIFKKIDFKTKYTYLSKSVKCVRYL